MPHHHKEKTTAFLALSIGVALTGVSAVIIKAAETPGVVTAFYRMAIGSTALLIPFLISQLKNPSPLPKKGILFAILAGIFFGLDMALWATGIVATNATVPTLAANLAPAWAAIGAMIFFSERPRNGFWVGLSISFLGVILMVYHNLALSTNLTKGILLGLGAGAFYGMYYLAAQKGREQINTLNFLSISTFSSALTLFLITLFSDYKFTGYSNQTYGLLIAYGIGVQVFGWWLINYAQGFLRATVVAPTLLGQPIVTAAVAFWVLNERHTLSTIIGGVIIISGIFMVYWTRRSR